MAIRYLLLSAPYRTQLNFTADGLEAASASLERLRNFQRRVREARAANDDTSAAYDSAERALGAFRDAMDDDLNTSLALAALFTMVSEVNSRIDEHGLCDGERAAVLDAIERMDSVLGVLAPISDDAIPHEVLALVEERTAARVARDFKRADEIRTQITALGFVLEDTPDGTKARRKG
jgi:cysteinyl-tRNA synthetase